MSYIPVARVKALN